ncbi:unnamed protein product, partial [Ectocarpus fasciculatus]
MTPPKLVKTLAFLKLHPRRLVKQGLAPKALLARMKAEAANNAKVSKVPLGDSKNNEDLAESVAAGMELMSVEDDKKEWNDGFVSAEPDASATAAPIAAETPTPDNDNDEENDDAAPTVKKNLIHKAFIAGGIQLRPREGDHEAPGGGGGGRRGGPLFHPSHQHYAGVFDEDEGGHPGFHP